MDHATFATPDLTVFRRLDELGLVAVGQRLDPDRAVIGCRVAEPDPWCRGCTQAPVRSTTYALKCEEPDMIRLVPRVVVVIEGMLMNRQIGMVASGITFVSVALFAVFMLIGLPSAAFSICIVLACAYVVMTCSYGSYAGHEAQTAKYAGMAFAVIYATFVMLVYYAQITTVRQSSLTEEALYLLSYEEFGLFFAYNLFGYSALSISTFFVGLTLTAAKKETRVLRAMLLSHGAFSIVSVIPVLGLFSPGMPDGSMIGVTVLTVWCLYFLPVCFLSFRHFKNGPSRSPDGPSIAATSTHHG